MFLTSNSPSVLLLLGSAYVERCFRQISVKSFLISLGLGLCGVNVSLRPLEGIWIGNVDGFVLE